MVTNPDDLLEEYVNAGVDMITVHKEVTPHLDRTLNRIRELGCKAGVSINPATSISGLEFLLDKLDLILVMTVNPGFGGQFFIESSLNKIKLIKELIKDKLELNENRAKNFEIGLYNYTIKESKKRKIIRKWENPYFVLIYKDKFRSIWNNLFNNSSSENFPCLTGIPSSKSLRTFSRNTKVSTSSLFLPPFFL